MKGFPVRAPLWVRTGSQLPRGVPCHYSRLSEIAPIISFTHNITWVLSPWPRWPVLLGSLPWPPPPVLLGPLPWTPCPPGASPLTPPPLSSWGLSHEPPVLLGSLQGPHSNPICKFPVFSLFNWKFQKFPTISYVRQTFWKVFGKFWKFRCKYRNILYL